MPRANLEHPAEHETRHGHRPIWRKTAVRWQAPVIGSGTGRPTSRELPPHYCERCDEQDHPEGLRLIDLEGRLSGDDWFYIRAHLRKLAQSAGELEPLFAEAVTRGADRANRKRSAWQFVNDIAHDYTRPDRYGLRDGAYVHEVLDRAVDPRWHLEQQPREELVRVLGSLPRDDATVDEWISRHLPGIDLEACAQHYWAERDVNRGRAPWQPFPAGIGRTEHKWLTAEVCQALGRRPGKPREQVRLGPVMLPRGGRHRLPDEDEAALLEAAYVRWPFEGWQSIADEFGFGSADAARKAAQRTVEELNGRKHAYPRDMPDDVTDLRSVLEFYGVELPEDRTGRVSVRCPFGCGMRKRKASVYLAGGKQRMDFYLCPACPFSGTARELWEWAEVEQDYQGTRRPVSRTAALAQIKADYNPEDWLYEGL